MGGTSFRASKLTRNRLHSQGEDSQGEMEQMSISYQTESSVKIIFAHLHEDAEVAQETQILPSLPCSLQSSQPRSANCGMVAPTPMDIRWSQDPALNSAASQGMLLVGPGGEEGSFLRLPATLTDSRPTTVG